ncbi:hypothetical protein K490DRAFT_35995 [Saccharata proteae CBS 121410]|uniref:Uncharacterized protein n=1 Tax=Saccharata proteae CBS 121410 TaxID=1314787 RepID=A0A9P4HYK2_9PEZI|nr:hypothetical protein K490DRAFT_35995 [Saccharata proteae CBS 121410]
MLRTLARRAAEPSKETLNAYNNPYRAKRLWPPDLSKLSPKHQFRLERKYKRRSALRYQRPGWIKGVKLVQYGTMICTGCSWMS